MTGLPSFLHLLFPVSQNPLVIILFKELYHHPESRELLKEKINELLNRMTLYPEAFFWYLQKITGDEELFFNTQEGRWQFLKPCSILLHFIEDKPDMRDLGKKSFSGSLEKRYELVRLFIKDSWIRIFRRVSPFG